MPKLRPEEEVGDQHLYWLDLGEKHGGPEKALWAAVLVRAMTDVALWHAGKRHPSDERGTSCHSSLVSAAVYRDAWRWFRQRSPKQMGFLEVCEALGVEPERVRRRLRQFRVRPHVLRATEFTVRRERHRVVAPRRKRVAQR